MSDWTPVISYFDLELQLPEARVELADAWSCLADERARLFDAVEDVPVVPRDALLPNSDGGVERHGILIRADRRGLCSALRVVLLEFAAVVNRPRKLFVGPMSICVMDYEDMDLTGTSEGLARWRIDLDLGCRMME